MSKDLMKRFQQAYDYLYQKRTIKSKTELAKIIGSGRTSVSYAYNGNPDYLNDKFLIKFYNAFPGVFNLDWLLTGEGEMLKASQMPQEEEKKTESVSVQPDIQKWLMKQNEELVALLKQAQATIDRKEHELSELRKELKGDAVASQKTIAIVESH